MAEPSIPGSGSFTPSQSIIPSNVSPSVPAVNPLLVGQVLSPNTSSAPAALDPASVVLAPKIVSLGEISTFAQAGSSSRSFFRFFDGVGARIRALLGMAPKKVPRQVPADLGLLSQVCRASPMQAECPRAVAQEYVQQFLLNSPELGADEECMRMAQLLSGCTTITRQIDRLQEVKGLRNDDRRVGAVVSEMQESINELGEGRKCLLPAGWWDKGSFHDGLVEVRRSGDRYSVRFISTDESMQPFSIRDQDALSRKSKTSPHFTFEGVTREQLTGALLPMLELQVPELVAPKQKMPTSVGMVAKAGQAAGVEATAEEKAKLGRLAGTSDAESPNLNPLVLFRNHFNKEPIVSAEDEELAKHQKVSADSGGGAYKNILAFFKTQKPEQYQEVKLRLEIKAFLEITERCDGVLSNNDMRHAVLDSARRLRQQVHKHSALFAPEVKEQLLGKIDEVQKKVREAELAMAISPKVAKEWSLKAPESGLKLAPQADVQRLSTSGSAPIGALAVECSQLLAQPRAGIFDSMPERLAMCRRLYDAGDFSTLEELVLDSVYKLPLVNEFQAPARDTPEANLCLDQFHQLCQYLFEGHLDANLDWAPPDVVVAMAKLDALAHQVSPAQVYASRNSEGALVTRLTTLEGYSQQVSFHFGTRLSGFRYTNDGQKELRSLASYWRNIPGRLANHTPAVAWQNLQQYGPEELEIGKKSWSVEAMVRHVTKPRHLEMSWTKGKSPALLSMSVKAIRGQDFEVLYDTFARRKLANRKGKGLDGHRGFHAITFSVREQRPLPDFPNAYIPERFSAYFDDTYKLDMTIHGAASSGIQYGKPTSDALYNLTVDRYGVKEEGRLDTTMFTYGQNQIVAATDETEGMVMLSQNDSIQRNLALCATSTTSVQRTLRTFFAHPEYFEDPAYVRIFEQNVYATHHNNSLLEVLQREPAFLNDIAANFSREYQLAVQSGNIFRAAALLEQGIKIQAIATAALSGHPGPGRATLEAVGSLLPSLSNWQQLQEQWLQPLSARAVGSEERGVVRFQELAWTARALREGKATLAAINIPDSVSSYFEYHLAPKMARTADTEARRDIGGLMRRLAGPVDQLAPEQKRALALRLLQQTGATPSEDSVLTGSFPSWKLGEYQIDFSRGQIFFRGEARALLPDTIKKEIATQPHLQVLFAQMPSNEGHMALGVEPKSGEAVTFFTPDSHRDLRFISKDGESVRIQKRVIKKGIAGIGKREVWYDLMPVIDPATSQRLGNPEGFETFPPPIGTVLEGCTVWRRQDNPEKAIAIPRGSTKPLYELSMQRRDKTSDVYTVKELKRADGMTLMSASEALSSDPEYGQLFGIEAPRHTMIWGKDGTPKSVEYPRLKMADGKPWAYTLSHQKVGGERKVILTPTSTQFDGCHLDLFNNISAAVEDIVPPTFQQFHLLESSRGVPKMVLAFQELQPYDPERGGANMRKNNASPWLNRSYFDRQGDDVQAQRLLIADIDMAKGKLNAKSKDANAMLAYLFFAHKDYDRAAEYFDQSQTASRLTDDHVQVLKWGLAWPDATDEAMAFKLKAGAMLMRHVEASGNEEGLEASFGVDMHMMWRRYNEHREGIPEHQRLSEDDKLYLREQLGGGLTSVSKTVAKAEVNVKRPVLFTNEAAASYFYTRAPAQKPFNPGMPIPVAGDKFLQEHFGPMYSWVATTQDGEAKRRVVSSLRLCTPTTPMGETLRHFLLKAAESPSNLPAFPSKAFMRFGLFTKSVPVRAAELATGEPPGHTTLKQIFSTLDSMNSQEMRMEEGEAEVATPLTPPKPNLKDILRQAKEIGQVEPETAKEHLPIGLPSSLAITEEHQVASRVLTIPTAFITSQPSSAQREAIDTSILVSDGDDAATQRLMGEIIADTAAYRASQAVARTVVGESDLKEYTATALTRAANQRKASEDAILAIVNAIPKKGVAAVQAERLVTIPDRLFGLYSQHKVREISADLSPDQIEQLDTLMKEYMLASIEERVLTQLSSKLDGLASADQATLAEIDSLINIERHYSDSHPKARTLLLIEYGSGFVLREGQVRTMEVLLGGANRVRQLAMGGGKTSVLVPALLNEYADGTHLAVGLIPEWLYEIVADELDRNCSALFGQRLYRFEYDEAKATEDDWLDATYNRLTRAVENRDAVITTRTHQLSFRNKFLELLQLYKASAPASVEREEYATKLEKIGKIINLFKMRAKTIADEVDTLLDVRQKHIRADGAEEGLPPQLLAIGMDIYRRMNGWAAQEGVSPDLKAFSQALLANRQAEVYDTHQDAVKNALAKEYYAQWSPAGIGEDLFVAYLTGAELNEAQKGVLDLDANNIPAFMQRIKESNPGRYAELCYAKQYLAHTLDSVCSLANSVRYGRGKDGVSTSPYRAINQPTTDKFGERAEEVMLHCQDYLQAGLTTEQVHDFVQQQKQNLERELTHAMIEDGHIKDEKATLTWQKFNADFPGFDLTRCARDAAERKRLQERLNSSGEAKLAFAESWVLPNLTAAPRQVVSTPFDLVDLSGEFSGFSGTPWNPDTYSDQLDVSHVKDPGTDGKTIDYMLRAQQEGRLHVRVMSSFDDSRPVESIIASTEGFWGRYDSLIDAGAYVRGPSNEEIARTLADSAASQGVTSKRAAAFVDSEDKLVLQDFGSDVRTALAERKDVPAEERFNIYDGAHTIGTDMPNGRKARAALTVGEDTPFFKGAQAAWRMRGLGAGQEIDIILKPEVARLIKPPNGEGIEAKDVIRFMVHKQATREADDNYSAETERIKRIIPRAVFWDVVNTFAEGQRPSDDVIELADQRLYTPTEGGLDSLARIRTKANPSDTLQQLKQAELKACAAIPADIAGTASAQLTDYTILDSAKLPVEVDATAPTAAGTIVQQQQQLQEQQQQQQQQQVAQTQVVSAGAPRDKWSSWSMSYDTSDFCNNPSSYDRIPLSRYATFIGDKHQIVASKNIINPQQIPNAPATNRKQINRILVAQGWGGYPPRTAALLLDLVDYENVVKPWIESRPGGQLAVYEIGGPAKRSVLGNAGNDPLANLPEAITLVAIAKFWGGEPHYFDKAERDAVLAFLAETADTPEKREELRLIFEERLMSPEQRRSYNELSPIYRFFRD